MPDMDKMLEDAFHARGSQIQDEVDSLYADLTERERRLMREAAVAAWVSALRHHGVWGADIPKDSEILNAALWTCHKNEDLYPIFTQYVPEVEED